MADKHYTVTRVVTEFEEVLPHDVRQIAKALIRANYFILSIKYIRRETGCNLYVAKHLVDALRAELEAGQTVYE